MQAQKVENITPVNRSFNLPELSWNEIDRPGCYLIIRTGDLVRVSSEGVAQGHSPLIKMTSNEETRVARLSESPSTPISSLRATAADSDYFVNF
jgi:hypothetical protein